MSNTIKQSSAIELNFRMDVTLSDGTFEGSFSGQVQAQGNSFKLINPQLHLFCDGLSKWIHTIDEDELVIFPHDTTQNDLVENPVGFLISLGNASAQFTFPAKPKERSVNYHSTAASAGKTGITRINPDNNTGKGSTLDIYTGVNLGSGSNSVSSSGSNSVSISGSNSVSSSVSNSVSNSVSSSVSNSVSNSVSSSVSNSRSNSGSSSGTVKQVWVAELTPVNKRSPYRSVIIEIEKSTMLPVSLEYLSRDGSRYKAIITSLKRVSPWPASNFKFPDSRLSGLTVTDLR